MAVPSETIWSLDPHTAAKHEILRLYLQRWFPILSKYHGKVVYIDGFCGPGRYKAGEPGSPLVALDVAANHISTLTGDIVFLFIDEDRDRIDHLKSELAKLQLPHNFKILTGNGRFDEELKRALDNLDSTGGQMAPTFVFIDPFGFSGVPYSLVARVLGKSRSETLITFMVDSVNRWLDHPNDQIRNNISEIFGTTDCFGIGGHKRIDQLRDLYQRQLQKAAKFVRYFEMRNRSGRVVYLLFFASNHRLGHLKMKEAIWAVDPQGEFKFSDATNPEQNIMFGQDQPTLLWPTLHNQFRGKRVSSDLVREFVEDHTPFLAKHMRSTLIRHEDSKTAPSEIIRVADVKADGTRRKKGTFPDGVVITFPQ